MMTEAGYNLNGKVPPAHEQALPYPDVAPDGATDATQPETPPTGPGLPPWERVKLARHSERPHTLEYIQRLCSDFVELHGDRLFGDDAAIVGGLALFDGQPVMVIGHQKGHSTKENIARNFAQAYPEGFRKAQRLMDHAARFGFPILTFIDTPGANPGMQAEERGIGQAIAANLMTMLTIETPIIATVIGEGGSGGALAIGVGDRILMLENSIYSVASPEASAAILWHDAGQASAAAEAMRITALDLLSFGIIDEIVPEPEGGAHTDPMATIDAVQEVIARNLAELRAGYDVHTKRGARKLLEDRHLKYERMGKFREASSK